MIHLPQLITDLALILVVAGVVSLLFKKLRQPVVLGYILAGVLVGSNFPLFPSIGDGENIRTWSEIGVIFLLFSLGLEFSFKKLLKVGGVSSVTALIEITLMFCLGYFAGQLLGWSFMDRIFLGGIMAISSTTIIMRAFSELGLKGQNFTHLVFGVLIIEDLVAVVLLVLLSTIAVSQQFAGVEMMQSVLKLGFFLVLCFVAGIFFLPTLLKRAGKLMNNESLLIVSVGLCLLMVYIATVAGFSPALGAFLMGSILAETIMAERIEHLISPVKDLFGAIFFVSVGMLIEPAMLWEYALPILLLSSLIILGKLIGATSGALLSGQPLKTSLQVGASLTQIGEFSFIIATLGISLNVTSNFLYPVAVAVSAITTLTTPYVIRLSAPMYIGLSKVLPNKWLRGLSNYSAGAQSIKAASDWQLVLHSYFRTILIFSVLIISIILLSTNFLQPFVLMEIDNRLFANLISASLTIVVLGPFLWALLFRNVDSDAASNLWQHFRYKGPLLALRISRVAFAVFYLGFWLFGFFPAYIAVGILLFIILLISIFYKKIQSFYDKLEHRFLLNFNQRETAEQKVKPDLDQSQLTAWDAHITNLEVPVDFYGVGQTLLNLALREKVGINIAMIKRGEHYLAAPGRNERIFPGDKLYVIGTDRQVDRFNKLLDESDDNEIHEMDPTNLILKQIIVTEDSSFIGKSIRETEVREKTEGLVIGIERGSRRILNPESDFVFNLNDVLWIVGNEKLISDLR